MKTSLAIALLASATQAQQELTEANSLDNYAPYYRGPIVGRGEERHATILPAGYAYPRNPHAYYPRPHEYEEEHPYQYHPTFANEADDENEVRGRTVSRNLQHGNPAGSPKPRKSPGRGSPKPKGSPGRGSPKPKGSPGKRKGSPKPKGSPGKRRGSPKPKGSPGRRPASPRPKGSPGKRPGSPRPKGSPGKREKD